VPGAEQGAAGPLRDILFLQSTTEIGGAETVLLNLFAASAELRARALIVTLGFGQGDLPRRLRELGAEVVELEMPRLRFAWRLPPVLAAVRRLARDRGVRAIVGNGGHPQVVGGALARLSGAKSVFMAHMIYPSPLWKNDPRDVVALAGPCDLILAVSKAARDAAQKLRPGVPVRLLYNATPLVDVPAEDSRAARRELGVADDELLIGVFGRLQRWKGQDIFVRAAAMVARQRPRTRFAVVGGSVFGLEPEFLEALKRDAAAAGLADRLVFTGFRTDVPRLMAACDIICHTTRVPEPFGLVVLEAMAQGRPVIATQGGGPSEMIESASQGVLIPPEDSAALAAAITALADDPEARRRIGVAARERVKAQFTPEVAAATFLSYLDELASPSRSRAVR
jgi:glycosyltransferase involved in cell wall biosynthesis